MLNEMYYANFNNLLTISDLMIQTKLNSTLAISSLIILNHRSHVWREARIWFRSEMGGDETSLWISCGVALHTSCWNSISPASCWNFVASDSPIWASVYFRVVAKTVESSRAKIHRSLCTAVRGPRRTTTLRRYIDCGAFTEAWFDRIKRGKLWATCRWMSLSERTGLWSSLSRREQEEASSTSAAKSRHGSSMQVLEFSLNPKRTQMAQR